MPRWTSCPPQLKKSTRGIVPTYRGYALRTTKDKEAEIIRALLPETALELGPALGLQASSTWILRGVPRDANKEQIIRALSIASMTWPGWTVRPRRTLGQPRHGKVSWVVDAADDPPTRSITFNDTDCIAIDRYIESNKTPPKAAPWFKDHKPEQEIVKIGGAWSDEDDDDADGQSFTLRKGDDEQREQENVMTENTQVDLQMGMTDDDGHIGNAPPTPKAARTTPPTTTTTGISRRMQAAGFRANPYMPKAPPTAAPPVSTHSPQPAADTAMVTAEQAKSDRILDMLTAMQKENERKDALIQQLQDTIKMLNDQLTAMNAAMQQQHHQWQQQHQQHQQHQQSGQQGAGEGAGH
jgi:hypothetical protein